MARRQQAISVKERSVAPNGVGSATWLNGISEGAYEVSRGCRLERESHRLKDFCGKCNAEVCVVQGFITRRLTQ